jgi:hypothetical protein
MLSIQINILNNQIKLYSKGLSVLQRGLISLRIEILKDELKNP